MKLLIPLRFGVRLFPALAIGFLSMAGVRADGPFERFFRQADLETITVTDVTPDGRLRRSPTPAEPVYYVAVSAGYRDFGSAKAGEKAIAREHVNRTMLKVLAKQGYLPAGENQEPDIVLLWTWGTMNTEKFPSVDGYAPQLNQGQMLRFLGGEKLGLVSRTTEAFPEYLLMPGLFHQSSNAEALSLVARDDLYVAVVAAYDVRVKEGRGPVQLWQTRISSPARGFWLPEALPAMLAIAGPNLGRETAEPVWIRASEKFKPDIKLGDTKLVEYLESSAPAVVQVGPSR